MKKYLFTSLVLFATSYSAQVFTPTDFSSDGYPFSIGFPAKITKTTNPSTHDTMLTAHATYSGITYAISVSKVKSIEIAEKSSVSVISKLESKAAQVDAKKSSDIAGNPCTVLNYKNDKGSFITMNCFSKDRYIYQVYTLNKNGYLNDASNGLYFKTLSISSKPNKGNGVITQNTPNSTTTTSSTPSTVTTQQVTQSSGWKVNDRAEIFDTKENKWFGCIILKDNGNNTYKIGYDGYGDTYDEDVEASRIMKPTSNTTPTNVGYIRAVKGSTVSIKGNLKNGQLMEDLEWAESSSMACWVGIRNVEFEGNHLGYWIDLPKKSIVKITVTPTSSKTRINLYGYSGYDFIKIPPYVSRCTSCEASFPEWIGQPNLSEPAKPQTIEFNATTIRNRVYIGVAGARNVLDGEFTLTIEMQ